MASLHHLYRHHWALRVDDVFYVFSLGQHWRELLPISSSTQMSTKRCKPTKYGYSLFRMSSYVITCRMRLVLGSDDSAVATGKYEVNFGPHYTAKTYYAPVLGLEILDWADILESPEVNADIERKTGLVSGSYAVKYLGEAYLHKLLLKNVEAIRSYVDQHLEEGLCENC